MDYNISDIMDPQCVKLELDASKKVDSIKELLQLLVDADKLDSVDRCLSAIMERERISSTGVGNGIAIPHRLIDGVHEMMIAVGRKGKGLPFDSVDGKPAHLIFLIIGPQGKTGDYLKILSKLSRHLNDRGLFEAMMRAKDGDEMVALIRDRES